MENTKTSSRFHAIDFLIKKHKNSQSELASVLESKVLTQPILSSIQRNERPLHYHEARYIEAKLGIPDGWMDQNKWVEDGWSIIKDYRRMSSEQKSTVDSLIAFVLTRPK